MELLNKVLEALNSFGAGPLIATVAVAVEFALRLIKSEKPRSIMYLIADGTKAVGGIISKIGEIMDKVLPQRLK
jgi:DNA-binding HxlR family transcriptional regulator